MLLCNPIALGTKSAGSPFERLRQLLPLFAAIDDQGGRALIAVNRWSVVDPICARGALRDEIVAVTALAIGEESAQAKLVARDVVRRHCLDTEDGRDGDVVISHLRYDTAIRCSVEVDEEKPVAVAAAVGGSEGAEAEAGANGALAAAAADKRGEAEVATASLTYRYDEGPGAFTGESASRFLDWLMRGLRHPMVAAVPRVRVAEAAAGAAATASGERKAEEERALVGKELPAVREAPVMREAVRRTSPRLEPLDGTSRSEPRMDPRMEPRMDPATAAASDVWARPAEPGGAR